MNILEKIILFFYIKIKNSTSEYVLSFAAKNGNHFIVKILLKKQNKEISQKDIEALQISATNGHFKVVEALLNDKRIQPHNVIQYACIDGYIDIVELLLNDPRVDPSELNNHAIKSAAAGENRIIDFLKSYKDSLEKKEQVFEKYDCIEKNNINSKYFKIVKLLWSAKSVKDTLFNDSSNLYNCIISNEVQEKLSEF